MTQKALAKLEQTNTQIYAKYLQMRGQNGRGYCDKERIAGYLSALADCGVITDRERGILYLHAITHANTELGKPSQ